MTQLLTVKNAAKLIDSGEDTIRALLASGALTRYDLGPRMTRVSREELQGWVESCRKSGGSSSTGDDGQLSEDMATASNVVLLERLIGTELKQQSGA